MCERWMAWYTCSLKQDVSSLKRPFIANKVRTIICCNLRIMLFFTLQLILFKWTNKFSMRFPLKNSVVPYFVQPGLKYSIAVHHILYYLVPIYVRTAHRTVLGLCLQVMHVCVCFSSPSSLTLHLHLLVMHCRYCCCVMWGQLLCQRKSGPVLQTAPLAPSHSHLELLRPHPSCGVYIHLHTCVCVRACVCVCVLCMWLFYVYIYTITEVFWWSASGLKVHTQYVEQLLQIMYVCTYAYICTYHCGRKDQVCSHCHHTGAFSSTPAPRHTRTVHTCSSSWKLQTTSGASNSIHTNPTL